MNSTYESVPVEDVPGRVPRRSLTPERLEPWRGNVVDLTLADGSHRVGLLKDIENGRVRLEVARGAAPLPDGGIIEIGRTTGLRRAERPSVGAVRP